MFDQFCGLLGVPLGGADTKGSSPSDGDDAIARSLQYPFKLGKDHNSYVSPFIKYNDGYVWPELYSEIMEMVQASTLIYPLTSLRRMARNKEIDDPDAVKALLTLPMTRYAAVKAIEQSKKYLTPDMLSKYNNVLKVDPKDVTSHFPSSDNLLELRRMDSFSRGFAAPTTVLLAVDDEHEFEELVYSIEVNHARKIITVCFRGSITKLDWATDMEIYMSEIPNPLASHVSQNPTLLVHNGFRNYLFKPSSCGAKGPDGENLSQYQEIILQHVLPILRNYPEHKLYVTGHSLGAALATLFAFEAAALPDNIMPKPVSLFSIASPYVGDESFRSAHQQLESSGKLRHLRITNAKDSVTLVPKFSFRWNMFDSSAHVGALFKHVGMHMRLCDNYYEPLEISYPKVRTGYFTGAIDEFARGWDQTIFANFLWNPVSYHTWPYHKLEVYKHRIDANRAVLETLHLNDLYARPDIVGHLVPQF